MTRHIRVSEWKQRRTFDILAAIQPGDHQLMISEALKYEIGRIPDDDRRAEVLAVLKLASERRGSQRLI